MAEAPKVAFLGSPDAVRVVIGAGFGAARATGLLDEPVVLREVGPGFQDSIDGQAAILLDVPELLRPQFARKGDGAGPERRFAVPVAVADRFPVLAYRGAEQAAAPEAQRPEGRMRRRDRRRLSRRMGAALAALALAAAGTAIYLLADGGGRESTQGSRAEGEPPRGLDPRAEAQLAAARERRLQAQRSRAIGSPKNGSLVRGVPLPGEGEHFFTWNLPEGTSPNPRFRRFATFAVRERVERVLAAYRQANPGAPRVGIADLSLPRGGQFGTEFGGSGHVAHQNGTEVDILYPRSDGQEQVAGSLEEVDRRLAQALLEAFLDAGAEAAVFDARLGLTGPPALVETAPYHEDQMHMRFPR